MYLHKEQKCAKRDLCSKTGGGGEIMNVQISVFTWLGVCQDNEPSMKRGKGYQWAKRV